MVALAVLMDRTAAPADPTSPRSAMVQAVATVPVAAVPVVPPADEELVVLQDLPVHTVHMDQVVPTEYPKLPAGDHQAVLPVDAFHDVQLVAHMVQPVRTDLVHQVDLTAGSLGYSSVMMLSSQK